MCLKQGEKWWLTSNAVVWRHIAHVCAHWLTQLSTLQPVHRPTQEQQKEKCQQTLAKSTSKVIVGTFSDAVDLHVFFMKNRTSLKKIKVQLSNYRVYTQRQLSEFLRYTNVCAHNHCNFSQQTQDVKRTDKWWNTGIYMNGRFIQVYQRRFAIFGNLDKAEGH